MSYLAQLQIVFHIRKKAAILKPKYFVQKV